MKRLVLLIQDKIPSDILGKYGTLILSLSHFEWILQEFIILLVLKTNFDKLNNTHVILADHISKLNFDRKIKTIEKFKLMTKSLTEKINKIRKKRVTFVHGTVLQTSDSSLIIKLISRPDQEDFTINNITNFLNDLEDTGNQLLNEFENQGFTL